MSLLRQKEEILIKNTSMCEYSSFLSGEWVDEDVKSEFWVAPFLLEFKLQNKLWGLNITQQRSHLERMWCRDWNRVGACWKDEVISLWSSAPIISTVICRNMCTESYKKWLYLSTNQPRLRSRTIEPKKQTWGVNSVTDFCPQGFLNNITSYLPT